MSPRDILSAVQSMAAYAREAWGEPAADKLPGRGGPVHRAAQTGTIISIVVLGVVALVGILIFSRINQSLPDTTDPELENASSSVVGGFGNALELIPIVMLVLVASLVIGVVQQMRMN
jgi:hypothetical protein